MVNECPNCILSSKKLTTFRLSIEFITKEKEKIENELKEVYITTKELTNLNNIFEQNITSKDKEINKLKNELIQKDKDYKCFESNEIDLLKRSNKEYESDILIKEKYIKSLTTENKKLITDIKYLKESLQIIINDLTLSNERKDKDIRSLKEAFVDFQNSDSMLNNNNIENKNEINYQLDNENFFNQIQLVKSLTVKQNNELRKSLKKYSNICKDMASITFDSFNDTFESTANFNQHEWYQQAKIKILTYLRDTLTSEMEDNVELKIVINNISKLLNKVKETSIEKNINVNKSKKRFLEKSPSFGSSNDSDNAKSYGTQLTSHSRNSVEESKSERVLRKSANKMNLYCDSKNSKKSRNNYSINYSRCFGSDTSEDKDEMKNNDSIQTDNDFLPFIEDKGKKRSLSVKNRKNLNENYLKENNNSNKNTNKKKKPVKNNKNSNKKVEGNFFINNNKSSRISKTNVKQLPYKDEKEMSIITNEEVSVINSEVSSDIVKDIPLTNVEKLPPQKLRQTCKKKVAKLNTDIDQDNSLEPINDSTCRKNYNLSKCLEYDKMDTEVAHEPSVAMLVCSQNKKDFIADVMINQPVSSIREKSSAPNGINPLTLQPTSLNGPPVMSALYPQSMAAFNVENNIKDSLPKLDVPDLSSNVNTSSSNPQHLDPSSICKELITVNIQDFNVMNSSTYLYNDYTSNETGKELYRNGKDSAVNMSLELQDRQNTDQTDQYKDCEPFTLKSFPFSKDVHDTHSEVKGLKKLQKENIDQNKSTKIKIPLKNVLTSKISNKSSPESINRNRKSIPKSKNDKIKRIKDNKTIEKTKGHHSSKDLFEQNNTSSTTVDKLKGNMLEDMQVINMKPIIILEQCTKQSLENLKLDNKITNYICGNKRSRVDQSVEPATKRSKLSLDGDDGDSEKELRRLVDVKTAQLLTRTMDTDNVDKYLNMTSFTSCTKLLEEVVECESEYKTKVNTIFNSNLNIPVEESIKKISLDIEALKDLDLTLILNEIFEVMKDKSATESPREHIIRVVACMIAKLLSLQQQLFKYYREMLYDIMKSASDKMLIFFITINVTVFVYLDRPELIVTFIIDMLNVQRVSMLLISRCLPRHFVDKKLSVKYPSFVHLMKQIIIYELSSFKYENHKQYMFNVAEIVQQFWLNGQTCRNFDRSSDFNLIIVNIKKIVEEYDNVLSKVPWKSLDNLKAKYI